MSGPGGPADVHHLQQDEQGVPDALEELQDDVVRLVVAVQVEIESKIEAKLKAIYHVLVSSA